MIRAARRFSGHTSSRASTLEAESAGAKLAVRQRVKMSAFGGKADIALASQNVRNMGLATNRKIPRKLYLGD